MAREAMIASDAALLASGTAALECMLAKCPMVVGYRMKPFTFWLAKRLVKTEYVSLPNLLAGRELVKELLQEECELQNSPKRCCRYWRTVKPAMRCTTPSVNCISRSAVMPMSRRQMPSRVSTMIEFVYPHTHLVAGVDEVGRGPLVGAVVTAAVILDPARPIVGLNDSKNCLKSVVCHCMTRLKKRR